MSARAFDPRRLDVAAFAKASGGLADEWPLPGFARLADLLATSDAETVPAPVRWSAQGGLTPVTGAGPRLTLHLHAEAALPLRCQRCLSPLIVPLTLSRQYLFVPDEASAERLDHGDEYDVLVQTHELDLHELLEDELLLDLPLVPRHTVCPQPLQATRADDEPEVAHPFAALAALRRDTG